MTHLPAGTDPEGVKAISRWLSAATPPVVMVTT